MAESDPSEADLTCSICIHVFREPVSLPCSHTYCRKCLNVFAEKSRVTKSRENVTTNDTDDRVISCPICRSPAHLGSEGVAGLSVNVTVEESLRNFLTHEKCEENSVCCSMCDEKNASPAVKFCATCSVLYCEPCLSAMHPMKGPLKRHKLVAVEEYLSQKAANCQEHNQAYCLFCDTCLQLICNQCFHRHDGHRFDTIGSAYNRFKVQLSHKDTEYKQAMAKLTENHSHMDALKTKLQESEEDQMKGLVTRYAATLEGLQRWKKESVTAVRTRHKTWLSELDKSTNDQHNTRHEVKWIDDTLKQLSSGTDVLFVKQANMLFKRMNHLLPAVTRAIQNQENIMEHLTNGMKFCHPAYKHMVLKEIKTTPGPELKFILHPWKDHKALNILENGRVVCVTGEMIMLGHCGEVWTDGRFSHSRRYWELDVSLDWTGCYNCPLQCTFTVGVVHETWKLYDKPGTNCWGIKVKYTPEKVTYSPHSAQGCVPHDDLGFSYKQPHRLGFCLDCETKTFTVVDCSNDCVISCLYGVDVSQSVIPVINVSPGCFNPTFRLITWYGLNLPSCLSGTYF